VTKEDPWPLLAEQIFGGRAIRDGRDIIDLEAPYRAEDAALVPVTIRSLLPAAESTRFQRIVLVIDDNPAPLAATFRPGSASGVRTISTRVRVDSYTNIHVVAELEDGALVEVHRFVKAAGGCSAPAPLNIADNVPLGTMRFRRFPPSPDAPALHEAQLMIRHPNYSGMQMDQLTRLYVPARYVSTLRIWQGEEILLDIEAGISISQNPEFRFDFRPNGATRFRAEAIDSNDKTFSAEWTAGPAAS